MKILNIMQTEILTKLRLPDFQLAISLLSIITFYCLVLPVVEKHILHVPLECLQFAIFCP